ncbi:MAG: uracil-DNA glycosylase [Woeseiaceae bacterium]
MSSNHYAYLKEMGIDVWVERNPSIEMLPSSSPADIKSKQTINVVAPQVDEAAVETPEVTTSKNIASEIIDLPPSIETLDWNPLRTQVEQCQQCELSKNRQKTVFGAGDQNAKLMIIGDAPNTEDEKQNQMFSAEAGQLLNAMLKAMGYSRNDVYITNTVKCRTLDNSDANEAESLACEPYLLRQIKLLQPTLILLLGNAAAHSVLKNKSTMARLRGQLHYVDGINVPMLVSYHPAYLLRAPNEKRKAWEDLQLAMKELSKSEKS